MPAYIVMSFLKICRLILSNMIYNFDIRCFRLMPAFLLLGLCCLLSVCVQAESSETFYTLNTANGLSANRVWQIAQMHDGRIVVYTRQAVDVYDGQRFSSVAISDTGWINLPAYAGYTHLYFDAHDNLWIKEHRRMACVDLRRMRQRLLSERDLGQDVTDFFVDSRSRTWLVKGNRMLCSGNRLTLYLPEGVGQLQDIESIGNSICAFFDTGRMAEYSEDGYLIRVSTPFAGDEWRSYKNTSLVAIGHDSVFYQLRTGSRGSVVLTYNLHCKQWRTVFSTPFTLHTLTVTPEGALYATCPHGYVRIDPVTGAANSHPMLRLPDGSMLGTGINAVCLDREGGIWFGTYDRGVLYTSPFSGLFDTQPIDIRVSPILTSVYLNGQVVFTGKEYDGRVLLDVAPPYVDHITLSYDQNSVAFRFSTMNYVRPRSTCYRYRFSGTDEGWHTVTADTDGGVVDDRGTLYLPFVGLPPGKYVLEVMASTNVNVWNDTDIRRLEFEILPPWWATAAAMAVYVVLLFVLLATAFVVYGKRVRSNAARKAREDELMLRVKTLTERLNSYEGDGRLVLGDVREGSAHSQRLTQAEAEFVSRVTAVVKRNISNQGYTVEQLSRDLCMDRTGLYRKLTALLDKSPVAFIRSIRLQRAAEMLADGNKSVTEVAEATGFGSVGYFSKCFQTEYGCRPSDYPKGINGLSAD